MKRLKLDRRDTCSLCGYEFADETLVCVASGAVEPMKKDPNFLQFRPDWLTQKTSKGIALRFFHFHCFQQQQAGREWNPAPEQWECHTCDGHDFRKDRWAFSITVGSIGLNGNFVLDPEINLQGIMCVPCTIDVFGEGDDVAGEELLYGT